MLYKKRMHNTRFLFEIRTKNSIQSNPNNVSAHNRITAFHLLLTNNLIHVDYPLHSILFHKTNDNPTIPLNHHPRSPFPDYIVASWQKVS